MYLISLNGRNDDKKKKKAALPYLEKDKQV